MSVLPAVLVATTPQPGWPEVLLSVRSSRSHTSSAVPPPPGWAQRTTAAVPLRCTRIQSSCTRVAADAVMARRIPVTPPAQSCGQPGYRLAAGDSVYVFQPFFSVNGSPPPQDCASPPPGQSNHTRPEDTSRSA